MVQLKLTELNGTNCNVEVSGKKRIPFQQILLARIAHSFIRDHPGMTFPVRLRKAPQNGIITIFNLNMHERTKFTVPLVPACQVKRLPSRV